MSYIIGTSRRRAIDCVVCGKTYITYKASTTCSRRCRAASLRNTPEPPPVPGCRWVALTQGKFALVDEERFADINAFAWWWSRSGAAARQEGRLGRRIYMHHVVMPPAPGMLVDHKNGDGLDNRLCNLRQATQPENQRNVRKAKGRGKFKGVYFHTARRVFIAQIDANGRTRHLGSFKTEVAAARAYDAAAIELHGEFVCLNFPPPGFRSAIDHTEAQ